jgi:hypothetical protein
MITTAFELPDTASKNALALFAASVVRSRSIVGWRRWRMPPNSASLTDAFSSLRCAFGAANRER